MDFKLNFPNKRQQGAILKPEFYRTSYDKENTVPKQIPLNSSLHPSSQPKPIGLACKILLEDLGKRKPLSLVQPNQISNNQIIDSSQPVESSFYKKLSKLEEQIEATEADLKNIKIPEGFFSPMK